jgi:hypothetical protein
MEANCCNGWTKLYHPRGPQVTLPIAGTTAADYFASVLSMLDAGFLVDAPGLDAGERKEEVDAVLRITHESNGDLTPVVMLYSSNDRLEWAVLRVYLNNADDIAAFEKASGLKLAAIPVYEGDRLARDDSQKAKRYIVKSPRPFIVVMKANPNYSTDERDAAQKANQVYKTPKHKFVRWDGQASAVPVANQSESAPKALPVNGEELFRRLCRT